MWIFALAFAVAVAVAIRFVVWDEYTIYLWDFQAVFFGIWDLGFWGYGGLAIDVW